MVSWKDFQKLKERKYRDATGLYLVEGARISREALATGAGIVAAFFSESFSKTDAADQLAWQLSRQGHIFHIIGDSSFKKLCNTQHPQGIALVLNKSNHTLEDVAQNSLWLYLDRVSDPGNLGTLIRSAAWFGFHGVAISPDSVDLYNPKVVRATMGALFRMKFLTEQAPKSFFERIRELGGCVVGTVVRGGELPFQTKPAQPVALVLGSEAEGISPEVNEAVDFNVTIPGADTEESLNIAIAGSILMYELFKVTGGTR